MIKLIGFGIVFLSLVSTDILQAASKAEFGAAINVSGRQRMLSQKMAKESLLVHLKIAEAENKENLSKTIELFDSSLGNLIAGNKERGLPVPPNDEIKKQLSKVKSLWNDYKTTVGKQDLKGISKQSEVVLREMNKAVKMYEKASIKAGIKGSGKVINVAGRQRMLTQKMAKEIFLIAANENPSKFLKSLNGTYKLFDSSLDALINGSKKMRIEATSDPEIQNQLKVVKELWGEYSALVKQVIDNKKADEALLKKIAEVNPKVLKEMHKCVGMYEKLTQKASH